MGSIVVVIGLYVLLWGKNKEMQKCTTRIAQEQEELDEETKEQGQEEDARVVNQQVQGLLWLQWNCLVACSDRLTFTFRLIYLQSRFY